MGIAFSLKYKDTLLDLEKDTTLTVEWYSTLFNESEIFRGSYSYPVDLKLSSKNKTLLGMPHLLENRMSRQKIEVSILLFGHTWKNALYDYEVQGGKISGNLFIDNAIIADWLRDTTLPDVFSYYDGANTAYHTIDIGADVPSRTAYLNNTATADPGEYPMAFPGLYNYGWDGVYKRWDNAGIVNMYFTETDNSFKLLNGNLFFCPMFYLTWLIKEVCDKMGFKAVGSFLDHAEVKRWILYNNSYYTGREMNRSEFKIIPSRHLPKITIGSLFKILRNDLKLGIYFDSLTKTAYFNLPNQILENLNEIDLGNLIIRDSLKIRSSLPKKYKVKLAKDEGDATRVYYDSVESLLLGKADTETPVELSISAPLMNTPLPVAGYNMQRWPMVEQIANLYDNEFGDTDMYNKDGEIIKNEFTFRLLSYRGLQPYDVSNPSYVTSYATSDNLNALGVVDTNIIATDPVNTQSWLKKLCEPFYIMQHISEQVEFDMHVGVEQFSKLNPLAKGKIWSRSGAKQTILFDRITFEPKQRKSNIFAKVKAYSVSNSYVFMGQEGFITGEITKKENLVYVSAWFEDFRSVHPITYAKVRFNFYADKYCQTPLAVSNLKIHALITENAYTNGFIVNTLTQEVMATTGTNVITHLTSTEYRSAHFIADPASYWEYILEPIVLEGDSYIPVL